MVTARFVQRSEAEEVLKALQANQDAWQKVDAILEGSNNQQTKFFALQVSLVRPRWAAWQAFWAAACFPC